MIIYFIRHPQTEVNAKGLMHATYDPSIFDEVGYEQADRLAQFCKKSGVEAVYTSPALRAVETAVLVADQLGVLPIVLSGFRERSWGEWSGKRWPEIGEQLDKMSLEERYTFVPPGGESWQQVEARLKKQLQYLVRQPFGKVAVISHGGTLRALMPILKNQPKESSFAYDLDNASITTCEYSDGEFIVIAENETSHLN